VTASYGPEGLRQGNYCLRGFSTVAARIGLVVLFIKKVA
jgi:hypothetical protein